MGNTRDAGSYVPRVPLSSTKEMRRKKLRRKTLIASRRGARIKRCCPPPDLNTTYAVMLGPDRTVSASDVGSATAGAVR